MATDTIAPPAGIAICNSVWAFAKILSVNTCCELIRQSLIPPRFCIVRYLHTYVHIHSIYNIMYTQSICYIADDGDSFPWYIILILVLLLLLLLLLLVLCCWCWRRRYVVYEAEKLGMLLCCAAISMQNFMISIVAKTLSIPYNFD